MILSEDTARQNKFRYWYMVVSWKNERSKLIILSLQKFKRFKYLVATGTMESHTDF